MSASREILGMIDHAVLAPDAGRGDVLAACALAVELGVAGVCVLPWWVEVAAQALAGSGVACGTVVGFPLGANITAVKVVEAVNAFQAGAQEIDMVPAITALKSGDYDAVREDIEAVVDTASVSPADLPLVVKVILEMCYLTEKRIAAELAVEAGRTSEDVHWPRPPGRRSGRGAALYRPAHIGVKPRAASVLAQA